MIELVIAFLALVVLCWIWMCVELGRGRERRLREQRGNVLTRLHRSGRKDFIQTDPSVSEPPVVPADEDVGIDDVTLYIDNHRLN